MHSDAPSLPLPCVGAQCSTYVRVHRYLSVTYIGHLPLDNTPYIGDTGITNKGDIMHTEPTASRVEQYITAHRARVALYMGVVLTVLLYVAWHVVSRIIGIESPTLDTCVFGLSAMGSAIAALALYWGAE